MNEAIEALKTMVDLYKKHEDDFYAMDEGNKDRLEEYMDTMSDLMPEVCRIIGHDELIPDYCGMPKHDFCIRCGTSRERIEERNDD